MSADVVQRAKLTAWFGPDTPKRRALLAKIVAEWRAGAPTQSLAIAHGVPVRAIRLAVELAGE